LATADCEFWWKGYESEPEGHRNKHGNSVEGQEVTGRSSVEHPSNEGHTDSCEENLLHTEEVGTASQPDVLSTTKNCSTEAASLLPSSSRAAADVSDSNNGEQLSQCNTCSTFLEKFSTQEVGTTGTCNQDFSVVCLQE
jgi:hypothetical protein